MTKSTPFGKLIANSGTRILEIHAECFGRRSSGSMRLRERVDDLIKLNGNSSFSDLATRAK